MERPWLWGCGGAQMTNRSDGLSALWPLGHSMGAALCLGRAPAAAS